MELVAIKVQIDLGTEKGKRMVYPSFNTLPAEKRGGQDWAEYVDRFGGPHYDKKSKLFEIDSENADPNKQFVMYMIPEVFADAALSAFPSKVSILSAAEAESFYNDRAHDHEQSETVNAEVLNAIRAKYGIVGDIALSKTVLTADEAKALDPAHPMPGIVANTNKTFASFCERRGITIKEVR